MITSIVAPQARKVAGEDPIFAASKAAVAAAKIHGDDKVINATIGAILDEEGKLVFLKAVEDIYRHLPNEELCAYAPIAGLPEYLEAVIDQCFGDCRPNGHIRSVATAGGTGVIHHLVHNYTQPGDVVLTADWFWGAYSSLCDDNQRSLATFDLFTSERTFNHQSFQDTVTKLAEKQENLLIILNTPAHNPTGFSLTDEDWDTLLGFLKELVSKGKNKVILDVDVAYLDYSGPKSENRQFFKHFSDLPAEILTVIGYSMSKGYTMYGQRVGAMICVTSSPEVADEFFTVSQYTSRATWSNICRPAMKTLAILNADSAKQAAYEEERNTYYELIKERADIFMKEADECGLPVLPYKAGFFISIPAKDSKAVCEALKAYNVFLVPLRMGVRIAACAVSKEKMKGLAGIVCKVMKELGEI